MWLFNGNSTSKLLQRQDVQGQLQLLNVLHSKADCAGDVEKLLHKHPSCLPVVLQLLRSNHAGVQQQAAMVLGRFAQTGPTVASQVLDSVSSTRASDGSVAGLVVLLGCGAAAVQEEAAYCLSRLAWDSPARQDSIAAEPGAITGLTALLNSSDGAVQCAAAAALSVLSNWCPANRERIGREPGAVAALAALLDGNSTHAQAAAASLLTNLAWKCPANRQRIRQEPGAVERLTALLASEQTRVQRSAAWAVAGLTLGSPADSDRISQEPQAIPGLVALLSSSQADVQFAGALAMAAAAEGSSKVQQTLLREAAAVWPALCFEEQVSVQPPIFSADLSRLLHSLAAGSAALRQSMAGSKELIQLLKALQQRLEGTPDNMATPTLKLLTQGATSPSAVPSAPDQAKDDTAARDQAKTGSGPDKMLATTVGLLQMLEAVSDMVPILTTNMSAFIQPLTRFLIKVEQVRVNKVKARSMKSRADALMRFMTCMFNSSLQDALARNKEQLAVLQQQLHGLEAALTKAARLVEKWSKPMGLGMVVRFLKSDLDKEEIKDFDSTVNKAVQDLSSVLSALNLIHTLEMQQQLQRLASEASASDATLAQELDVANQQDIQELQGHLEQLLGGQAELQQQLAAATEQQRQEWFAVTGHMVQLAGDFGVIRDEVRELANAVRAWMDERIKPQDNCSAPLVRSSLLLDRERVQWETGELDSGGFASVYPGTFDGHDVAVKLLRLCAFAAPQQREQLFREAAVLSRLNHPCIVHFWGVVPVDEGSKAPQGAAQGISTRYDSARSYGDGIGIGGRPSTRSSSSITSKLSLGLVMDRCDESLGMLLNDQPLLSLPVVLHVAERIACGLKYLHAEAPVEVVHGDLKPANVLLKHGTHIVQLTDFGLSSTIAVHTMSMGAMQLGQNRAGQSGGTLHWAAPELLDAWGEGRDAPHTLACDIYSLGIILHQLLVGQMPCMGMPMAPEALKAAVRAGNRPSWAGWEEVRGREAGPDVLKRLQRLVEACWAPGATQRPTAQQVHAQLVELKRLVPAGSAVTM